MDSVTTRLSKYVKGYNQTKSNFCNLDERWEVTDIDGFFLAYCKALKERSDTYNELDELKPLTTICQRPLENMPIMIEVDFPYENEQDDAYDDCVLMRFIQVLQNVLEKNYENIRPESFQCVVLEREQHINAEYDGKSIYSYRILLHFPYFCVATDSLLQLIPSLAAELRKSNVNETFSEQPLGSWERNIKPITSEWVPLYGSSKRPDLEAYSYQHIFGRIPDGAETFEDNVVDYELDPDECLNIHHHSLIKTESINVNLFDDFSNLELLPLFLSPNFTTRCTSSKQSNIPSIDYADIAATTVPLEQEFMRRPTRKLPIQFVKELLPLVGNHRYCNKMHWLNIGRAMYTVYNGEDDGLNLWYIHSERAYTANRSFPKFVEDNDLKQLCNDYYSEFNLHTGITEKTLAWYAKEDNANGYLVWQTNWFNSLLDSALYGGKNNHNSVAQIIYCTTWLKYVCSQITGKKFWKFANHHWLPCETGYELRLEIMTSVLNNIYTIREAIISKIRLTSDADARAKLEKRVAAIGVLIEKLDSRTNRDKYTLDLADIFKVEDFEEYLDSKPNLTGHPNGVSEVDIEACTIQFRAAMPEDYIRHQTEARLDLSLSWDHPKVKSYTDFLNKVYPDPDTRHFVKKMYAARFVAGNMDKILPCNTGDRDNAKTTHMKILGKTWGSYHVKFPTIALMGNNSDVEKATPALMRLEKRRIGSGDESKPGRNFSTEVVKNISGDDEQSGRKLYGETKDFETSALIVVSTNRISAFDAPDVAIKERFVVIPHIATFLRKGYPETIQEQFEKHIFPVDRNMKAKMTSIATGALWVLYQTVPIYLKERLDDRSEQIIAATEKYWIDTDIYMLYMSDRIVKQEGSTLSMLAIWNDFETWFTTYNKKESPPDRGTIRYHLVQLAKQPPIDNVWHGIALKDLDNALVAKSSNPFEVRSTPAPSKEQAEIRTGVTETTRAPVRRVVAKRNMNLLRNDAVELTSI